MLTGPPYQYVYSDFVDRVDQITYLHQVVKDYSQRVILLNGLVGSGKTQLLEEFDAETPHANVTAVFIDLKKLDLETGYLDVCTRIRKRLAGHDFVQFERAQDRIHTHRLEIKASVDAASPPTGAPAGIHVEGNLDAASSNIAGRDQYFFKTVLPSLDPLEIKTIREELNIAFLEDLTSYTSQHGITILLDHWEVANRELRNWVFENLITPILNRQLLHAILVIACTRLPEWYRRRSDTRQIDLGELPVEAVLEYWERVCMLSVDEMNLRPEELRFPQKLVLEARRAARRRHGGS